MAMRLKVSFLNKQKRPEGACVQDLNKEFFTRVLQAERFSLNPHDVRCNNKGVQFDFHYSRENLSSAFQKKQRIQKLWDEELSKLTSDFPDHSVTLDIKQF